jgi:hypothetical protein
VLRRTGFDLIGRAPDYLRIAGRWRDHLLVQRLVGEPEPTSADGAGRRLRRSRRCSTEASLPCWPT